MKTVEAWKEVSAMKLTSYSDGAVEVIKVIIKTNYKGWEPLP